MKSKPHGFTLIELMIVILVLAILATLAYPSYERYIRQTRLNSVRPELIQNARNLERYYAQKTTFEGYNSKHLIQNKFFDISFRPTDPNDPDAKNPSASGFVLQASPNADNPQESCTVFLDDSGIFWATSATQANCPGFDQPSQ